MSREIRMGAASCSSIIFDCTLVGCTVGEVSPFAASVDGLTCVCPVWTGVVDTFGIDEVEGEGFCVLLSARVPWVAVSPGSTDAFIFDGVPGLNSHIARTDRIRIGPAPMAVTFTHFLFAIGLSAAFLTAV